MEKHDELTMNNRHFSFFWCPVAESPDTSIACRMSPLSPRSARARRLRDEGDEPHRRATLLKREEFRAVAQ